MSIQFERKISIDGVAVILASIALITFMVTLKIVQDFHAETLKTHSEQIEKLTDNSVQIQQVVAQLAVLIQERTGKLPPPLLVQPGRPVDTH